MAKPIEDLAKEGILTQEAVDRLKAAWVCTVDEVYARIKVACESKDTNMRTAVAQETGLQADKLEALLGYIRPYVENQQIDEPVPEHPLGYRIDKK